MLQRLFHLRIAREQTLAIMEGTMSNQFWQTSGSGQAIAWRVRFAHAAALGLAAALCEGGGVSNAAMMMPSVLLVACITNPWWGLGLAAFVVFGGLSADQLDGGGGPGISADMIAAVSAVILSGYAAYRGSIWFTSQSIGRRLADKWMLPALYLAAYFFLTFSLASGWR